MSDQDKPELIFGLVGSIGVDLDAVIKNLEESLSNVGYESHSIRLTNYMTSIDTGVELRSDTYVNKYNDLIAYADAVRKNCNSASALAGTGIVKIQQIRDKLASRDPRSKEPPIPAYGHAFIIRQFKRREEVELMRETYGRKFILISVYLSEPERIEEIGRKIEQFDTTPRTRDERLELARTLVRKDKHERNEEFGQRVEEVFHLGDVFVPGKGEQRIEYTVSRFVNAFFGSNKITPNRYEYGMYTAAGASLRSSDLSRQVGAAIFSREGEVIAMGCNEVPKAKGGTYWDEPGEEPVRDIDRRIDANHKRKQQIVHDFVTRLSSIGVLNAGNKSVEQVVADLLLEPSIKDSQLLDIIEFGRMVHAEMNAVTDAARNGFALRGSTLFCTTFPCHMCAKHIVSSGVYKVVFLEPYPKSYAEELHDDSITFDKNVGEKVLFEPFVGISPRRYRDIFEKGKRKDSSGKAMDWIEGAPVPRIEDRSSSYLQNEKFSLKKSLGGFVDQVEKSGTEAGAQEQQ